MSGAINPWQELDPSPALSGLSGRSSASSVSTRLSLAHTLSMTNGVLIWIPIRNGAPSPRWLPLFTFTYPHTQLPSLLLLPNSVWVMTLSTNYLILNSQHSSSSQIHIKIHLTSYKILFFIPIHPEFFSKYKICMSLTPVPHSVVILVPSVCVVSIN